MNTREEEKIHSEGMGAYEAGEEYDDCPYRKGSTKRDIWQHGWDTAFELEAMDEDDEDDAPPSKEAKE